MAMVRNRAMMPSDMSIEIHTAIICVAEAAAISKIGRDVGEILVAGAAGHEAGAEGLAKT
jgi:hypothetical protein